MKFGVLIYIAGLIAGVYWAFTTGGTDRDALILSVGLTIVWLICGGFFLRTAYSVKNATSHEVNARVISKTTEVTGGNLIRTAFLVSFEFNNHRESFNVDSSIYNTLLENEAGVLKYDIVAGKPTFVSFTPDSLQSN